MSCIWQQMTTLPWEGREEREMESRPPTGLNYLLCNCHKLALLGN